MALFKQRLNFLHVHDQISESKANIGILIAQEVSVDIHAKFDIAKLT